MSLNWWSIFVVLAIATVWDIAQRRIPNWLVVPFLAAGLVWSGWYQGVKGLELSLAGMAVAALMVICHVPGVGPSTHLKLNGTVLARIFAGWKCCTSKTTVQAVRSHSIPT